MQNSIAQIAPDVAQPPAQTDAQMLSRDEFAKLTGRTPQVISYHLTKGCLKRHVDTGRIQQTPWRIPVDLVDWFLAQNDKDASQGYAQAPLPFAKAMAQTHAQMEAQSGEGYEKAIETLETLCAELKQELAQIKAQNDTLRDQLTAEKVARAGLESRLALIDEKEKVVVAQGRTIRAQEMANEALHIAQDCMQNERLLLTEKLQLPARRAAFRWPWQR